MGQSMVIISKMLSYGSSRGWALWFRGLSIDQEGNIDQMQVVLRYHILIVISVLAIAAAISTCETTKPGGFGMEREKDIQASEGKGAGFRVAIAHSLQKIPRSGPGLDSSKSGRVILDAARDETESFQLVVIPDGKTLKNVKVEVSELKGPGSATQIQWNRVGYVETAPTDYKAEYVGWWPDPLLPPGAFDVSAGERQPLWFNAVVPPDARPGMYGGKITIHHASSSVSVPVELRVRSFRLPRPGTLATAFGMYLPALARWWYGKEPSKMPIEVYARWCEFMGKLRLAPKNLVNEYKTVTQDEKGMKVDLSNFKEMFAPIAALYYAPYSFGLCRLPSSPSFRSGNAEEDPLHYAEFVRAHAEEWEKQGLPPEVYLYGVDEPRDSEYSMLRGIYTKIRETAPNYPIMQTLGDPNPEALAGLVDIWCPLTPRLDSEFYAKRREAGDTLWTYVCCGPKPPHANFFIDQPATDHRVVFWQTRQFGATGFLYWCVCIWDGLPTAASGEKCFPDAPIHMKDHTTYKSFKVNGDGLLAYPGPDMTPMSSIRLEVIRDGIEDYEYLALLSRLVEKAKALPLDKRPASELIQKAEDLCIVPEAISRTLTNYTKDPAVILKQRSEIADTLEQLTDLLGRTD